MEEERKIWKNAEKDDFDLEGRAKHLFAGQNTQHPFLRHSQNLMIIYIFQAYTMAKLLSLMFDIF